MREKAVKTQTIEKYIDFLNGVKENALPYQCQVSLETIVTNYAINKSVVKPLQKLNIINRISKNSWEWIAEKEPDKAMVLALLDYVLHSNKQQIPALLPDYITKITDLLKEISEKLNPTIEIGEAKEFDRDKEFKLVSSIAGGVYKEAFKYIQSSSDGATIQSTNAFIISAANNLLNQFNAQKQI